MTHGPRRLYFICEGQTEEAVAKQTSPPTSRRWAPSSSPGGGQDEASCSGPAERGGGRWTHYLREIRPALGDRSASRVTTMIDLYGYPDDGPGLPAPVGLRDLALAQHLEVAMADDVGHERFLPHLQVHEVEALLLSSPEAVGARAGDSSVSLQLREAVASCGGPELVDQGVASHPAARVTAAWPRFAKTSDTPSLVSAIGLPTIRAACPHFDSWLTTLEQV